MNDQNDALLRVNIAVSEHGLSNMDSVVEQTREVGLYIDGIFNMMGIITGMISPENISKLQAIEDVTAVELGSKFNPLDPNHERGWYYASKW